MSAKKVKGKNELKNVTEVLLDLIRSKEASKLQSILAQLINSFKLGYKLNYSDSYHIAKALTKSENDNEYVSTNLDSLLARASNGKEVNEINAYKLLDYVKLEITRNTELNKSLVVLQASFRELDNKADDLSKKFENLNADLKTAKDTIEKSQTTAITVIGLFSAIIMSFFGGISFTDQSLTILSDSSPIRLVFVLALVGFVLFNLLFLILYIVGKLTGRKICSQCLNSTDTTKKICTCVKQSFWCKMTKRYPYVLWTNCILVFLLVCMASIWISTLFFNRTINPLWVVIITGVVAFVFIVTLLIVRGTTKNSNQV